MGRPKTVNLDPDSLLAAVVNQYDAALAALDEQIAELVARHTAATGHERYQVWSRLCSARATREDDAAEGVLYRVPEFLGHDPTDTERLRVQQAIRRLEADGLVAIKGAIRAQAVRPTEAGRQRLRNLAVERKRAERAASRQVVVPPALPGRGEAAAS